MKHHFRRHRAVLKGELDTNVLKSALLHWHVLHVLKLVLTYCVGVEPKRPYATEGAVAQKLRRYHVTVE